VAAWQGWPAAERTYRQSAKPKSSLRLSAFGRALSDDYIRPYALCYTPDFLAFSEPAVPIKNKQAFRFGSTRAREAIR